MKYFFARAVLKLAQFALFAGINIPSKGELLIISAKFLPLLRLYTYILFVTTKYIFNDFFHPVCRNYKKNTYMYIIYVYI